MGHTAVKTCLKLCMVLSSTRTIFLASIDSDDVVMACPLCNAEHLIPKGGFPCNHFLLNLLEIYEAQEDEEKVCSYCQFDSISSHAVAR